MSHGATQRGPLNGTCSIYTQSAPGIAGDLVAADVPCRYVEADHILNDSPIGLIVEQYITLDNENALGPVSTIVAGQFEQVVDYTVASLIRTDDPAPVDLVVYRRDTMVFPDFVYFRLYCISAESLQGGEAEGIATECCGELIPADLYLTIESGLCCGGDGPILLTYDEEGPDGAAWYSDTFVCGEHSLYWWFHCGGFFSDTDWTLMQNCDGPGTQQYTGPSTSCSPFEWSQAGSGVTNCQEGTPYTVTVTA